MELRTIPHKETDCPVAPLAEEAKRLIAARDAADQAATEVENHEEKWRLEDQRNTADRFLKGTRDRATYLRANSGKGALFQLCVVWELAQVLGDLAAKDGSREAACINEMLDRTLYSLVAFIERVTGDRMADACGDYFLDPKISDHSKVEEAIALAANSEKAA